MANGAAVLLLFLNQGITGKHTTQFSMQLEILVTMEQLWMQQGAAGNTADSNAIATIAYANSGNTHHAAETNWGEHISYRYSC